MTIITIQTAFCCDGDGCTATADTATGKPPGDWLTLRWFPGLLRPQKKPDQHFCPLCVEKARAKGTRKDRACST